MNQDIWYQMISIFFIGVMVPGRCTDSSWSPGMFHFEVNWQSEATREHPSSINVHRKGFQPESYSYQQEKTLAVKPPNENMAISAPELGFLASG